MGVKQVLIAVDQVGNALLGGYADETLSARCYRLRLVSRAWANGLKIVDFLFGKGHCRESYESEERRRHLPVEYRR